MLSAVSRTMAILEELSEAPAGMSAAELVRRLRLEKSIVSRILASLVDDGYVVRDPASNAFRIGLPFVGIALRHLDATGIADLCLPLLQQAASKTGETIPARRCPEWTNDLRSKG